MEYKRVYTDKGNRKTTCPNCGAAIEKDKCDFCGTVFVDMACVDTKRPFVLKINNDGVIMITNVLLRESTINSEADVIYASNVPITTARHTIINMNFEVVDVCD